MGTRPDITFTTQKLSEANSGPSDTHSSIASTLLRYIQGTISQGITVGGQYDDDFKLRAYADASFADDLLSRFSTAGHIVYLGDGPVFWKSRKQTIVTVSSTEAEFINLTPAGLSVLWIKQLLKDMGFRQTTASIIFTDSHNARYAALDRYNAGRTRHIDIRYKWIIDRIARKDFDLIQVGTTEMAADGLTKPLQKVAHDRFVKQLNLEFA